MTDKGKVKGKPTAREKLEQSRLKPDKLEGMGDIDLRDLVLRLKGVIGLDVINKVQDVVIERTIEGASTLTVTLSDEERKVLRSGRLVQRTDIEIDGLHFRLRGVSKQGDDLTLTFEDREISLLRRYAKKRTALRSKVTRAEFVLGMIREVKEEKIRYKIPELHKVQPIEKKRDLQQWGGGGQPGEEKTIKQPPARHIPSEKTGGSATVIDTLTVKGEPATPYQLANATIIVRVGLSMQARRKVLVAALMTAIQESTLHNLSGGDRDSVGLFQQRASWGSFSDRHDPATAAKLFFNSALKEDKAHPGEPLTVLCQNVQRSAFPDAYAKWHTEADALVSAYGEISSTSNNNMAPSDISLAQESGAGGAAYMFYRGVPPTTQGGTHWGRENSWTCIQRLAGEVNWRAFMVNGVLWFVDEEFLFKMATTMSIAEGMPGIDSIDFDYKENKKAAIITVNCRAKRWAAPPGAAIAVHHLGPVDGRYIVSSIRRSLFKTDAEITLKKPRPMLPEPAEQNLTTGTAASQLPTARIKPKDYPVGGVLVQPVPSPYNKGHGGVHDTIGLPDYPAIDFFGKAGSPVVAPETGMITRLSGHDPAEGAPLGAGGPLGWSIYMTGTRSGTNYYMTHLGKRFFKVGEIVGIGQQIATIADYDKFGRASHVHCGVNGGSISIQELGKAGIVG